MENSKFFMKKTIQNSSFHMVPVEIIVPFYGEHARVSKLLDSIFKTVYTNPYLITLVDDGSVNDSFVKYVENAKLPGVRCFRQNNKGFGSAINLALKNPYNNLNINYVVILHSDVFFEDNYWLSNLGNSLIALKNSGVKMMSPLTNNSSSPSKIFESKKGEYRDDIISEHFLPMYCAISHRELFNQVGLFKECPYAGVEVEDFAFRMKKMGYKQGICGKSWVNHFGKATLNNLIANKNIQQILENTREDFKKSFSNS
jgi:GT2 family glycosyltransferase